MMRPSRNSTAFPISFASKTKKAWTELEDNLLRDLVAQHGSTNWTLLSQFMTDPNDTDAGRSGKQCRERWHNHLNPTISKVEWTQQEDATIVYLQRKFGNQWALITKYLPGRSDNAVKNRFHATCRNKFQGVDLSDMNLPMFVANAEPIVEAPAPRRSTGSTSSAWTSHDDKSSEEYYGSEDELDFDQHVQKIKNYVSSMPISIQSSEAPDLRDDIATSPLTNTSMSIGELALDELMNEDEEDQQGMEMGMGMGMMSSIMVEPIAFTPYEWGSNQFEEEAPSNSCFSSNQNGFCGSMANWAAPVMSMSAMCDFNMDSSSYDDEYYEQDAQQAYVCDVVDSVRSPPQHSFLSPSMAFCAPRR